jgi:hypothetical protein
MVHDKVKGAEEMRIRMGSLQSGAPPSMTRDHDNQPQRQLKKNEPKRNSNATGRGGGGRNNIDPQNKQRSQFKASALSTSATVTTDEKSMSTPETKEAGGMEESVPMISDITEQTTEGQIIQEGKNEPMEEDEDGLATIMLKRNTKNNTNVYTESSVGKRRQE